MLSQMNRTQSVCLKSFSELTRRSCSNSSKPYNPDFVNRNPVNMELLRVARKPQGYCLDVPSVNYWNSLHFDQSIKYLSGYIMHHSGIQLVSASTKEWAIRKHLYSAKDVSAAENVGRILAQRCLQIGLLQVHTELKAQRNTSERISSFLQALEDGGIELEESPQIRPKDVHRFSRQIPTFPWEVTEDQALAYQQSKDEKEDKR